MLFPLPKYFSTQPWYIALTDRRIDGLVKSPSAALRFTFVVAAYLVSTPLSSAFARLASGAFYFAIQILTFYEIIRIQRQPIPSTFHS
jgi:hypothetical protein